MAGDATITIYNGTSELNQLVAWGLSRFETAGLTPPAVASVTFTLTSDLCDDARARYDPTPAGAELTLCFDEPFACWDDTCTNFTPASRSLVLHELAHAWMDAGLAESVRQRFIDHAGLEVWSDHSYPWIERAVEHAADAVAWGLLDRDMLMYRTGSPNPDHLATGFRILTGTEPLPKTDEYAP